MTFLHLTTIVVLQGGGYGGGYGGGHGGGTACIVKGSYCQCHYCKCEKGHVSCKGYGHDKGYGNNEFYISSIFYGHTCLNDPTTSYNIFLKAFNHSFSI